MFEVMDRDENGVLTHEEFTSTLQKMKTVNLQTAAYLSWHHMEKNQRMIDQTRKEIAELVNRVNSAISSIKSSSGGALNRDSNNNQPPGPKVRSTLKHVSVNSAEARDAVSVQQVKFVKSNDCELFDVHDENNQMVNDEFSGCIGVSRGSILDVQA